jgi:hypothetical protein
MPLAGISVPPFLATKSNCYKTGWGLLASLKLVLYALLLLHYFFCPHCVDGAIPPKVENHQVSLNGLYSDIIRV